MTNFGFATEDLQFDIVGEEALVPNISQLADNDISNHEILCMDTTQTDIISGLDNSSGPIRFSILKENRWKPYSDREKQRLEEQNTRRAILVQKELLRCGLCLSPLYVPHFDDHRSDVNEVEKIIDSRHREISCSSKIAIGTRHREISSSSEEFSSSPDEDDESMRVYCDDFNKEYDGKSNLDLVKEFMEAEDKLAELEKIRVYRKEIEMLTQENKYLFSKNRKLHSILCDVD